MTGVQTCALPIFIIWLNAALMDSKISLFQTFSIFGYSMYPLNIVALVLSILMNWYMVKEWFRIVLIVLAISWCTFNLNGFIRKLVSNDKKSMMLYPGILFYFAIGLVILQNRF